MNKENIVNFLRKAWPFLLTIGLWRLSGPFWNQAGFLAIVPIFYYCFARPTAWFAPFGAIMCFVIDYKFGTGCFWLALYCLMYAINGFQNIIDITRADGNGILIFMVFIGFGLLLLFLHNVGWWNLVDTIWMFLWTSILYTPIITLSKRVTNDR